MKMLLLVALPTVMTACGSQVLPSAAPATLTTALVPAHASTEARGHAVHWPDGRVARGTDPFAQMFVFAPDAHAVGEPTRSESGEWTTLVRVVAGTFTAPRSSAAGQDVVPTGKPFQIWFATVSHRGHERVDDEYVFWSERTLRSQIGR